VFSTQVIEQYDEDVALAKVKRLRGRPRTKSVKKLEEAITQPKIEEEWQSIKEEYQHPQSENQEFIKSNGDIMTNRKKKRKVKCENEHSHKHSKNSQKSANKGDQSASETPTLACVACGKMFSSKIKLNLHKYQQGKYHNIHCPKCPDLVFKSWPENQQHQNTAHNGEVFLRCRFCPEIFENFDSRLKHFKVKHEAQRTKKAQCSDCGKIYSKCDLKYHQQRIHGTKDSIGQDVPCQECPESFPNRAELRKHKRNKHNRVCCAHCGKDIAKEKQRFHELTNHTPEDKKPFICPKCVPVKGFATKQQFEEHMYIHSGVKPFSCKLCHNMSYSNRSNLLAHNRQVHQGKKRKVSALH